MDLNRADWVERNVVNPMFNTLVVEPCNAASSTLELLGAKPLPRLKAQQVDDTRFGSAEYFAQNISAGMANAIIYAAAGKVVGAALRSGAARVEAGVALIKMESGALLGSSAFKLEAGAVSSFIAREKTAQIAGAA